MSSDIDAPLRERTVCFIVTGFGPFRDVPSNPTTTIVHKLVEFLRGREKEVAATGALQGICSSISLSAVTRTLIIETSAQEARTVINDLYDDLSRANSTSINGSPRDDATTVIFLHLGVNYKGTAFQIESCAYNEASFRVPDERGDKPEGDVIIDGQNLGAALYTSFDVPYLVSTLEASSLHSSWMSSTRIGEEDMCTSKKLVSESCDPGRFVCNYTYCLSLDRCQRHNQMGRNGKTWSVFLHVPPFDQVPEPMQLEFVSQLMDQLVKQTGAK